MPTDATTRMLHAICTESVLDRIVEAEMAEPYAGDTSILLWSAIRTAIACTLRHPEYAATLIIEDERALWGEDAEPFVVILDAYGDLWPGRFPLAVSE